MNRTPPASGDGSRAPGVGKGLSVSLFSSLLFLAALSLLLPTSLLARDPTPAGETPSTPKKSEEKNLPHSLKGEITLGDGRKVQGTIHFDAPSILLIEHNNGGISFTKTIKIDEISSIKIDRWKGDPVRKHKQGFVYRFHAARYEIRLKDQSSLIRDGDLFPFWRSFIFENGNGKTRFFTFWIDLKQDDGSWYTGIEGPADGLRNIPHPDVVQKIEFGTEKLRDSHP